jgi:predicted RNA-binding Zn-ribbon protein involved in translation (DUF1610 family)
MSQSRYLEPKTGNFEVFDCPELGKVSPKTCENCRLLSLNQCPLEKHKEDF